MEKGQGPHEEMPAPPYPGPPLGGYQAQPDFQPANFTGKDQGTPHGMAAPPYHGPSASAYPPPPVFQPAQQPVLMYSPQQPQFVQPVNQQVVVVQQMPSDCSGLMVCPYCRTSVLTTTKYVPGMLTWLICGILGVFGCWLCCCIPFCVSDCQDVEHSCPTCLRVLHIHKRS